MKLLPIFALLSSVLPFAAAQTPGVIDDPDGFTNLRAEPSTKAEVVSKVNKGEVFEFETIKQGEENPTWLKVALPSGKTGFMHASRVKHHASASLLADTSPQDEVNVIAKEHGFDYFPTARAAAKGDSAALKRFFSLGIPDGGWGENHCYYARVIAQLAGDAKFADFYKKQNATLQENIRETLASGLTFYPFEDAAYLKRYFPKTSAAFGKAAE